MTQFGGLVPTLQRNLVPPHSGYLLVGISYPGSKQWNTQHCSVTSMLTSLRLPPHPGNGGGRLLWNTSTHLLNYTASPSRGSQSLCSLLWETQRRQWRCLWQPWNCTSGVYSKEAHWTNTTRQTLCGIYIKSWKIAVENWFLPIFLFFLFFHYRNFPLEPHDTCPHSLYRPDWVPSEFLKISFSTGWEIW